MLLRSNIVHNYIMDNTIYPFPKANPRHRLAAYVLDSVLYGLTFGIGWIIWSLAIWNRGQTPGKQILKMRVYNKTTALPARWGQMLVRQALILPTIWFLGYLVIILNNGIRLYSSGYYGWSIHSSFNLENLFGGWGIYHWVVVATSPFVEIVYTVLAFWIFLILYLTTLVDLLWVFRGGERNRLVDIISKTDVLNEAKPTSMTKRDSEIVDVDGNASKIQESFTAREIREATELFQNGHISEDEYSKLKRKIIENK